MTHVEETLHVFNGTWCTCYSLYYPSTTLIAAGTWSDIYLYIQTIHSNTILAAAWLTVSVLLSWLFLSQSILEQFVIIFIIICVSFFILVTYLLSHFKSTSCKVWLCDCLPRPNVLHLCLIFFPLCLPLLVCHIYFTFMWELQCFWIEFLVCIDLCLLDWLSENRPVSNSTLEFFFLHVLCFVGSSLVCAWYTWRSCKMIFFFCICTNVIS